MDPKPPKHAEKMLKFFLREELAEEILGDLEEKFFRLRKKGSVRKAKLNYWFQALNYLRPFAFKYLQADSILTAMIRYNFLIGFRILLKNKLFSVINIGGLAIGMTVAILIGLWIQDEFSYDTQNENYDRIVQVFRKSDRNGNVIVSTSVPGHVGVTLEEDYHNYFEKVAMTFYRTNPQLLKAGEFSAEEMGYIFQPAITEILSFDMVAGSHKGLENVFGILLSKTLAQKMFNLEDPMGKTITMNGALDLIVEGVYKDFPENSTFGDADYFLSQQLVYNDDNPYSWDNFNIKVFGLLREGVQQENASLAIKEVLNKNLESNGRTNDLFLLPMKDWHLNANFENGVQTPSERVKFIKLYAIVGMLVLLIACINFMNLNTARYQTRGKEVGIRKAIGSFRHHLIWQFLAESMIYAFAGLLISLAMVFVLLPWFSSVTDKELFFPYTNLWFWGLCIAFALFSALVAGSYPALFLSSFDPINALKGKLKQGAASVRLRQGLVIFQFTISIILIISTMVVYQQINYAKERPVGYVQNKLLTVKGRSEEYVEKFDLLKTELLNTGNVSAVGAADYPLSNTLGNNDDYKIDGKGIDGEFNNIRVSPEYGAATKWELLLGRDFSRELDEKSSIIISEAAADLIGLDEPLGKIIEAPYEINGRRMFTVVGVERDMVKESPFEPPKPLIVYCTENPLEFMFIRIKPNAEYADALFSLQEVFDDVLPGEGFNYTFVDEEYSVKFKSEEQVGNFASIFCILAVLISCLGLFGLSEFVVSQRVKEIGIRKELGASVKRIWTLLSRGYSILIMISCIIAIPFAFQIMTEWLNGYSYRVELGWWVFAIGCLICLIITAMTVSYHSLKIAHINPVEALRTE